jgi:hypothetical protein
MMNYEITALVDADFVESYERYMIDAHIPDLMATGCFIDVKFTRSLPGRYRVLYFARDRDALDEYFRVHAARLRGDFAEHFPAGIEVSRENWDVLGSWADGANS